MRNNRFPFAVAALAMACSGSFTLGDQIFSAESLRQPPQGVEVGRDVQAVRTETGQALQFEREAITVPLASSLSAASGTVRVRFQLPADWPSTTRGTLFHVGQQAHVHVTLMVNSNRLVAVYKASQADYASINFGEAARWSGGSWHEAVFSWQADDQTVNLYLEADGKLVGKHQGRLITQWPDAGYIGARRVGQCWQGLIDSVHLSDRFSLPSELRSGRRTIVVDGRRAEGQCYNFWSINNYTSQQMFADPAYGRQAKRDKPFMKSVNCVRLLGGRDDGRNQWFLGVDQAGEVQSNFAGMVQYLQGMQDAGYTPRIVLDNIPTAMSEPGELAKYGNTRPARDLDVWHQYVSQAVRAMIDAFGREAVSQWRFRVGTEPDLFPGHWQGTKQQYLQHYDCTVDAVCSLLPDADIGPGNILNPAKTEHHKGVGPEPWGLDIVDHCAAGQNTWTGKQGTRICFLECSWYGQVGRPIDSLDIAINRMRERLARYPRLADLPISIAEFAVLQDEYNRRLFNGDITQWGASWYAAVADRVYNLDVQQVHEWAQATGGILHPRTRVIEMLQQMQGGERLHVSINATSAARAGAIACQKQGSYYILLYNHRAWRTPSIEEQINLTVQGITTASRGPWVVQEWGIDQDHGVFAHQLYADCAAAKLATLPDSPLFGGNLALRFGPAVHKVFAQNRSRYAELSETGMIRPREPITVADGVAKLTLDMPGHSVRLLVLSPRQDH